MGSAKDYAQVVVIPILTPDCTHCSAQDANATNALYEVGSEEVFNVTVKVSGDGKTHLTLTSSKPLHTLTAEYVPRVSVCEFESPHSGSIVLLSILPIECIYVRTHTH